MAYNASDELQQLTHLTDKIVDRKSDQAIEGQKTFINGIVAANFTLTDGSTLQPAAIEIIEDSKPNAILVCNGDKSARATAVEITEKGRLIGDQAIFKSIKASGKYLSEIPSNQLVGNLPLNLVPLKPHTALAVVDNQLSVDLNNVLNITLHGQTIADLDTILVYDVSHNALRKTTLKNLYDNFIDSKMPHPGGQQGSLQFKAGKGFTGSAAITFDKAQKVLSVDGGVTAINFKAIESLEVGGSLACKSAQYHAITQISTPTYTVQETDYTILADVSNNSVTITLPDASSHRGRVINIKLMQSAKYSIKTNKLCVVSAEGAIDLFEDLTLTMSRSSRTVQSDGTDWWVINGRGS